MRIHSIGFKWFVMLPFSVISKALSSIKFVQDARNKDILNRVVGEYILQIEYRPRVSTSERSNLWIRWFRADGKVVSKEGLERLLSEWFFTISQYGKTSVTWMRVILELDEFNPLYGYTESSPKIWTRLDKPHRFSFYPVGQLYYFDVRNSKQPAKEIIHQRFSVWLEDLKHNLFGHARPDDQMSFDLVV